MLNFGILYGSSLDICISIERITKFSKRFTFFEFSPKKLSFILFLICALVCPVYGFLFQPFTVNAKLNQTTSFQIYFWKNTDFAVSLAGNVSTFTIYFIRDILILIMETGLNVYTIILLKNYLRQKKTFLSRAINADEKRIKTICRTDRNSTIMVIAMCTLSTMQHIFMMTAAIYFTLDRSKIAIFIGIVANFSISIKHFSNLIVVYLFNGRFRINFKRIFKCF